MNNRVCTCANNPKNSWPNLPHDSTCPLAEDQAQCPDCYTLGTMGPCKKHATLVQGRGGPARIENDSLCAACGHKALEHGTEGRCYFVDRTVEPIKRCHCDNFQTTQAEPIDELAKQIRPSKLDTLNEAFRRAYIECPAHVIDDLKRRFDDFLADALRAEGREIKNILHEVCQILAVELAPGLARYAPLIARARELAHEGERTVLALFCEKHAPIGGAAAKGYLADECPTCEIERVAAEHHCGDEGYCQACCERTLMRYFDKTLPDGDVKRMLDSLDDRVVKQWLAGMEAHIKEWPNLGDCEWNCLTAEPLKGFAERVRRETREEAARLCEKWGQHTMADKLRTLAAREDLTRKKQE